MQIETFLKFEILMFFVCEQFFRVIRFFNIAFHFCFIALNFRDSSRRMTKTKSIKTITFSQKRYNVVFIQCANEMLHIVVQIL